MEKSSWAPLIYKINRAPVSDMLAVQQRVMHKCKGNFPKFQMNYNLHTRITITGISTIVWTTERKNTCFEKAEILRLLTK